jgi:hypothetical protein
MENTVGTTESDYMVYITVNGTPVGVPFNNAPRAHMIENWLRLAIDEIAIAVISKLDGVQIQRFAEIDKIIREGESE